MKFRNYVSLLGGVAGIEEKAEEGKVDLVQG